MRISLVKTGERMCKMDKESVSKAIQDAVHRAYEAGYKDGYYAGANQLIERIIKMQKDYINED